jgi:hypothetical protein
MKILLSKRPIRASVIAAALTVATGVSAADKKYDSGASDTEIRLGQTVPHSGPGSLYGVLGRIGEAYFQMLNEKGGINGRKIKFFTLDDSYSAPRPSKPRGGWSSRKKCWPCSVRWAPHRRPRFTNISIQKACRSFC